MYDVTNEKLMDAIETAEDHYLQLSDQDRTKIANEYMATKSITDADLTKMENSLEEIMSGVYTNLFYKWYYINKMKHEPQFECKCSIVNVMEAGDLYDAVEVHPVAEHLDEDLEKFCEQCDESEADMFSVYLHRKDGGLECIADFSCKEQAYAMAAIINKLMPPTKITASEIDLLAKEFSKELHKELTADQMQAIVTRNAERNDYTCATHDFCDPNMTMKQAFENIYNRPYDFESERDNALFNRAWDQAKENNFKVN